MQIKTRILVLLISIFSFSSNLFCQEITEPSYKLEFLKATYEEFPKKNTYSNQIVLYFKYSKKEGDKTLMSMRIKYKIDENGEEIIEDLAKSNHSVTVFGDTHTKRKPHELYDLLNDKFNFNSKTKGEDFIFAFYLRDITEVFIPTINFAYGLWEPTNEEVRIEQNFKINLELLND